jgi:LuxR family maltose regulon positive regulatory protein
MTQNITPQPIKEILVTKLHPPQVHFDLVARPRLYTRLDAWTRYDVTLISAPAGFGKTTLLSSWCSTLRPDTYAWLALDSSDNDPIRFWTYIITALRRFFSDQWEQRFSSIQSLIQSSSERLLTILINALTELPHDIALILDDYHIITSPELHTAMTFLLDHMPARFHLILAGRGDPPLPLARLRARRHLNELRTAVLL